MATYEEKLARTAHVIWHQQAKIERFWSDLERRHEKSERKRLRQIKKEASRTQKKLEAALRKKQRGIERDNRCAATIYAQANRRAVKTRYRLRCKLLNKISSRLRPKKLSALRRQKARSLNPLDCSFATFKRYIEKLFKPDMTWANYNTVWQLEYICSDFDPQEHRWFSYKNTRPVFTADYAKCLERKEA